MQKNPQKDEERSENKIQPEVNVWETYKGKIVYLVENGCHIADEDAIVFAFGDNWRSYVNKTKYIVLPAGIEQMSIILDRLIYDFDKFLIDDSYIMQSRDRTAMGKGAAIKGFIAKFRAKVKKLNKTIIFISEDIDHTLTRNFRKFAEKG